MSRTGIDGDQVQDETLTGVDVLNDSIEAQDLNTTTPGQAVITKIVATGGLELLSSTGADPGTGIVTLKAAAGGFGGDFYSAFDETLSSTTSNNWITKIEDTTEPVSKDGQYIIIYTAEVGQSQKQKRIGSRISYRTNGGAYIVISDIQDALSTPDVFQLRTGFFIIPSVAIGDTISVRIEYGQTDDGGIGRIKNSGFISWRVS